MPLTTPANLAACARLGTHPDTSPQSELAIVATVSDMQISA